MAVAGADEEQVTRRERECAVVDLVDPRPRQYIHHLEEIVRMQRGPGPEPAADEGGVILPGRDEGLPSHLRDAPLTGAHFTFTFHVRIVQESVIPRQDFAARSRYSGWSEAATIIKEVHDDSGDGTEAFDSGAGGTVRA
jgi:hypothetical protein